MKVTLLTSSAKMELQADAVSLPTTEGRCGVLAGHEPVSWRLSPGEVVVHSSETHRISILGGLAQVRMQHLCMSVDEKK